MLVKRQEWPLINAKEAWRGVLEDSSNTGDDQKFWRVIK